jgi:hypothetical protein
MATKDVMERLWKFAAEMQTEPPRFEYAMLAETRTAEGQYWCFFVLLPIGHPGFKEIVPIPGGRMIVRKEPAV